MMKTGTSFQSGMTTGRGDPCLPIVIWSVDPLNKTRYPSFSNTRMSFRGGCGVSLGKNYAGTGT